MGAGMLFDFVSFDLPPVCILEQIKLDALGTLYSRLHNSSVVASSFVFNTSSLPKKKKKKKRYLKNNTKKILGHP